MSGLYDIKQRFSFGEVSKGLIFRGDTAAAAYGVSRLKNATLTPNAGITNIPKLEITKTIENISSTEMRIVKYTINKKNTDLSGYLFLFLEGKIKILRQDNFKEVGEIVSNYTKEEIPKLSISQFDNTLIICVENKKPEMIRVNEEMEIFEVVEYWENIKNPPVKRVETQFTYSGEDQNIFNWYSLGANTIFESTLTEPVFESVFLESMKDGTITIFGGTFGIDKIENLEGKQKITTTQREAPDLDVPKSTAAAADKVINILDIIFSVSLFKEGYPAVVTVFKGRVIFGNVGANPSAVVSSRVYDSLNFRQSLDDGDGFTSFISGVDLNTVKDFIPYKSLIVLTDKGIYSSLLNEALTPATSEFYKQNLPTPKGAVKLWTASDGTVSYVDDVDRINTIMDIGSDNAYAAVELTVFSSHLNNNIKDIYFFKLDKNNVIGIEEEGEEGRLLTFKENPEEGRMCWSRSERPQGINEYVNINNNIYIFSIENGVINIYTYSKEFFEPLEVVVQPTTLTQRYKLDLPEYLKTTTTYKRLKLLIFGNYDIEINGKIKRAAREIGEEETAEAKIIRREEEHIVEFPNVSSKKIEIKQMNDEKIEILGIFASVDGVKKESE